jgi:hypothetical protein
MKVDVYPFCNLRICPIIDAIYNSLYLKSYVLQFPREAGTNDIATSKIVFKSIILS